MTNKTTPDLAQMRIIPRNRSARNPACISRALLPRNRSAQEEMIGFALIMIIVVVILVVFLAFSLRNPQKEIVESYEVNSFIQSFLQYTTDCRDNLEYVSIQKLIFDCYNKEMCLDERETCKVLNSTLEDIINESWKVGEDRPIQGYELIIIANGEEMLAIKEGNITKNSKGSMQDFSRSGENYEISFKAYY